MRLLFDSSKNSQEDTTKVFVNLCHMQLHKWGILSGIEQGELPHYVIAITLHQ